VKQLREFKRVVPKKVQELWQINEQHLAYLHGGGFFTLDEDENHSLPIRLEAPDGGFFQELHNTVPQADKDKQGVNQTLLIFEVLYTLSYARQEVSSRQAMLDMLLNKLDALVLYRSRYLQGPENRRAYCMFTLIITMLRQSFDITSIKEHTASIFKEMEGLSIAGIEVILYETAWEMMLQELRSMEEYTDF
jgi:hypothetical protein